MSKNRLQGILILLAIAGFILFKILSGIFSIISDNFDIILITLLSGVGVIIGYLIYSEVYFRSKKFNAIKESISEHINNCNELNHYIEELKGSYVNIETYNYGEGQMIDNSRYNFERKEWSKSNQNNQTYQCSATVFKNAINQ